LSNALIVESRRDTASVAKSREAQGCWQGL
jgi:hypothetical protein